MNPRLTTAQLRVLQPGDRVSRQLLGTLETARVQRLTNTTIVVAWPDGSTVKYWRESGSRMRVPLEVLRKPDPEPKSSTITQQAHGPDWSRW